MSGARGEAPAPSVRGTAEPTGSRRRERLAWLWWRLRGGEGGSRPAALRLGASVGVGLFVGALPLFGLHLPLCLAICLPLGLDVVAAYAAAQISNPLMAPALVTLEAEVGFLLLTGATAPLDPSRYGPRELAAPLALGAPAVGLALGLVGGASAALVARLSRAQPAARPRLDLGRTLDRYAGEAARVRGYVTGKLLADPALDWLLSQPGVRGHVLDLGCGHGQLGLALLDAGAVTSLHGVDHDEPRLAVAARAGGGDATFEVGSLDPERPGSAPWAPVGTAADVVLLIDVLHYLDATARGHALTHAAAALAPGGVLLLRVPGAHGARAALTRGVDVLGRRLGVHRGATVAAVEEGEVRATLQGAGLTVGARHSGGWLGARHLLVAAQRP